MSVIFKGSLNKTTLLDLKYNKIIKADSGENGKAKNMFGKDALDVIIEVPLGTVVRDLDSGEVIADITKDGEEVVIARGGKGGRGNAALYSKILLPKSLKQVSVVKRKTLV